MKGKKPISLSILRQAKGLTQKDLAVELGVSSALIAMYETGKRSPKLSRAIEIAKIFDVPVESIAFKSERQINTKKMTRRGIYTERGAEDEQYGKG